MRKILIVDDEEMMLMLARRILSSKYEVITTTTGAEAVELFEREHPDLVLSDLLMPEMDGYELQRILQESRSEAVPIIFMTADDSDESESKGFALGAADYIRKPLKPDVLLRRVGNIIDNLDKIHGLETAASTDLLTGLLNKTTSQKKLSEVVKHNNGALMMIDLDSFKLVNDIYGHGMGDKILIRFGDLLRKIIRERDLAGRIGGDEFTAFLQGVEDEKILQTKTTYLNEQLLLIAKKLMGSDMQIPLGVSVGAVFVPDEGTDYLTLREKADGALYDVKQHGKHGLAVFGTRNQIKTSTTVEGISQMRMILSERNVEPGAFFVEFETFKKIYQMLVRMADNYKKGLTLMQFTTDDDIAHEFKSVLIQSLRRNDCVSRAGNNFFVLLQEATALESDGVKARIFSRLPKSTAEKISFEREQIF